MPSKSPAQHRLMMAAAHTKGGFGGVPQSVGRDFVKHDKAKAAYHRQKHAAHRLPRHPAAKMPKY